VLAAQAGRRGESYLLGDQDVELPALARLALDVAGLAKPVIVAPFAAAHVAACGALWYADHVSGRPPLITPPAVAIARLGLAADCSKAARELGLPRRPLRRTIADALAWFAAEGYVRHPRVRRALLARCA
jgi:dihydroflavonol-4-reductase